MKLYIIILTFVLLLFSCNQQKDQHERTTEIKTDSDLWAMANMLSEKGFGKPRLSEYNFFSGPLANLKQASNRTIGYDLNTPLFTDYAHKERFIALPEQGIISYNGQDVLSFPEGSVLIKNFLYPNAIEEGRRVKRVIETRLLVLENDEWIPRSYIWNDDQTDAFLTVSGKSKEVVFEESGATRTVSYKVPTINQCKSCHMRDGKITPIGPTARQLHRKEDDESLLLKWASSGVLTELPDHLPLLAQWDDAEARLDDRARAYLDINCGACHRDGAPAKTSGLDLTVFAKNEYALGVGKKPVAAGKGSGGLLFDIVPGSPDESILVYRMESLDPSVMMPELGRSSVHEEGVALIRKWIEEMNDDPQNATSMLAPQTAR